MMRALACLSFLLVGCVTGRVQAGLATLEPLQSTGVSVALSVRDARAAGEGPLRRIEASVDGEVLPLMVNRIALGLSQAGVGVKPSASRALRVEVLDWWWLFTSREVWVRNCVFHVRLHASLSDSSGKVLREATVTAGDELGMVIAPFDPKKVVGVAFETLTRASQKLVSELQVEEAP
jgi:hypothetical protein